MERLEDSACCDGRGRCVYRLRRNRTSKQESGRPLVVGLRNQVNSTLRQINVFGQKGGTKWGEPCLGQWVAMYAILGRRPDARQLEPRHPHTKHLRILMLYGASRCIWRQILGTPLWNSSGGDLSPDSCQTVCVTSRPPRYATNVTLLNIVWRTSSRQTVALTKVRARRRDRCRRRRRPRRSCP